MLKKGFTLAEVLMTLAIIGVVAAMTLPSLNYNIGKQTLEKQTTKFYSQLHDGVMIDIAQNGGFSTNEENLRKLFNVVSVCDGGNRADCVAPQIKSIEGMDSQTVDSTALFPNGRTIYQLADGAVFTTGDNNTIIFDVNGTASPNVYGNDVWVVRVFGDGSIDDANMTPAVRERATAAQISTAIANNYSNCKQLKLTNLAGSAVKEGEGDDAQTVIEGGSGCFGHFLRNKFRIVEE